jgi:hypothetical protein
LLEALDIIDDDDVDRGGGDDDNDDDDDDDDTKLGEEVDSDIEMVDCMDCDDRF